MRFYRIYYKAEKFNLAQIKQISEQRAEKSILIAASIY
jgi:hypothetical protein